MKLRFSENPREWRKQALLTALGLAIVSSVLYWRHVIARWIWLGVLAAMCVGGWCALARPRWFRGYYRLSMRLGFAISQFIGRVVLLGVFIFIVTPLGWLLRLAGKDALQLKRPHNASTYWQSAKEAGPLDRLF